jgi:hypothetical protein
MIKLMIITNISQQSEGVWVGYQMHFNLGIPCSFCATDQLCVSQQLNQKSETLGLNHNAVRVLIKDKQSRLFPRTTVSAISYNTPQVPFTGCRAPGHTH